MIRFYAFLYEIFSPCKNCIHGTRAMKKENESVDISPFEPCKNQAEIRTKG